VSGVGPGPGSGQEPAEPPLREARPPGDAVLTHCAHAARIRALTGGGSAPCRRRDLQCHLARGTGGWPEAHPCGACVGLVGVRAHGGHGIAAVELSREAVDFADPEPRGSEPVRPGSERGQQLEGGAVGGADRAEVPVIDRRDVGGAQAPGVTEASAVPSGKSAYCRTPSVGEAPPACVAGSDLVRSGTRVRHQKGHRYPHPQGTDRGPRGYSDDSSHARQDLHDLRGNQRNPADADRPCGHGGWMFGSLNWDYTYRGPGRRVGLLQSGPARSRAGLPGTCRLFPVVSGPRAASVLIPGPYSPPWSA
jgi:hypothetical protein